MEAYFEANGGSEEKRLKELGAKFDSMLRSARLDDIKEFEKTQHIKMPCHVGGKLLTEEMQNEKPEKLTMKAPRASTMRTKFC